MKLGDLVEFAFTALARHRLRTGLSLLGIAIGVSAVVILTALGEGARLYVADQFAALGSNLLMIVPGDNHTTGMFPGSEGVPNDLTLEDARVLRRAEPRVRHMAPISTGNETVAHRERRRQATVLGSTSELLQVRQLKMSSGRFLPAGDLERGGQMVVLGATVADELFGTESPVGGVVRIGDWRMRVIGVLSREGMQIGVNMDDVVVVPVATVMQMFNRTSLFQILLKMQGGADLDATCVRVQQVLTERHHEDDVSCITQESVVASLSTILTTLTLTLSGIAAISLCVAGVGITNLMLVSVSERTQEVGLLKAVGAGTGQILGVFLGEAVLLATSGGLLGLAVGWVAVRALVWVYPAFPATTPYWATATVLGLSACLGALSGVLPARRAAGLEPVAALAGR